VQLCSLIQVFLGRELLVLSTLHVASVSVKWSLLQFSYNPNSVPHFP
jgi:hypothetical protein